MASSELNNTTIPSVTKSITQVKINQFEKEFLIRREILSYVQTQIV